MGYMNFSWVIDGKLAGHQAPSSEQDLVWLKKRGILALVRMAEKYKAGVTSLQISQLGFWDYHEPVPDSTAPSPAQVNKLIQVITESLAADRPVGVSCGAGLGRTGTILACYMVSTGLSDKEAIKLVREKRPGSIETKEQEEAVTNFMDDLEIQKRWPKTVEEAVDRILLMLSDEDKATIVQSESETDVFLYHHGLGTWVRNNFGLWKGNTELVHSCGGHKHPDDNSLVILLALWRKIHQAV